MTLSLDFIRRKMGWCPNARTMRTAPVVLSTPPADSNPAQPEGGAGGPGRIDRGITLATGSIRVLFRNRRLLWFSLMAGLVILFSLASSMFIQFISGTTPLSGSNLLTGTAPAIITQGSLPWIVLTFTYTLIYSFLFFYLLAALIVSVSHILSGEPATVHGGLAHAAKYLRPLFGWALIGAGLGTVFSFIMNSSATTVGSPGNLGVIFIVIAGLAVLGVITMFVVPLLVLGNKSLPEAVAGSLSLFGKMWREIIVCAIILFLIVFAIMLTSMVPIIAIAFSSGSTAAAGIVLAGYMLIMLVMLFIGSTIVGIVTTGLYTFGKTGTLSPAFKGKQDSG